MRLVKFGMLAVGACAVLSASAATYYVDAVNGDDGNDGTSAEAARKTFAAAVKLMTADGDGLVFAPGEYEVSSVFSSAKKRLSFVSSTGNPADVVLNGGGKSRGIYLTGDGGHLVAGLTFTNFYCNAAYNGSALAMTSQAGNSTVRDCLFACCTNTTAAGGAVYNAQHCVWSNVVANANYSAKEGGAISTSGDAYGWHKFYSCGFTNNAAGSDGGAVRVIRSGDAGFFYDCSFAGNRSNANGGAIAAWWYVISNCTLTANSAKNSGGALVEGDANGHGPMAYDCRFYRNRAANGGAWHTSNKGGQRAIRCLFEGNSATSGGVFAGSNVGWIKDCTFRNNTTTNGTGGAICSGVVRMEGTTFEGNSSIFNSKTYAGGGGGAWRTSSTYESMIESAKRFEWYDPSYTKMIISNCTFRGNSIEPHFCSNQSSTGATAASLQGTTWYRFYDCHFIDNFATNWTTESTSLNSYNNYLSCGCVQTVDTGSGGGDGETGFKDCTFVGNTSLGLGCAFWGNLATDLGMENCVIASNRCLNAISANKNQQAGNAVVLLCARPLNETEDGGCDKVKIKGCVFKDNFAPDGCGSCLLMGPGGYDIADCEFFRNGGGCADGGAYYGGTVAWDYNWHPRNSTATKVNWKDYRSGIVFNIDNCVFSNNWQLSAGGAIMARRCAVTNRTDGGVETCYLMRGNVRDCLFADNLVTNRVGNTTAAKGVGGAIAFSDRVAGTIANCTFVGNEAESSGGAVSLEGASVGVTNCVFYSNEDWTAGVKTDDLSVMDSGQVGYCFVKSGGVLTDGVNGCIVSDQNPFRSDDHCDLAVRGGCGQGAGLVLDWMTADSLDLGGKPRLADGCVDFGCYQLWFKPGFLLFVR